MFGRATPTRLFAGLVGLGWIRPIQPILSEMPTGSVGPQIGHESIVGFTSSVTDNRGSSGAVAGGACSGKVVTRTGDRHTASSTSGCESSSTDGIRTVDAPIPRGTVPAMAPATSAGDNHAVEKWLQQLVTETQSCPPPVMSPPAPTELEQLMRSFLEG